MRLIKNLRLKPEKKLKIGNMDTNSLTYKTLKNSVYSILGFAFPIILTIFVTPVVIKKIGVVDFGIFMLLNTISSFLSLVDLGLGNAVVKYVAEYSSQDNTEKLNNLLGSAKSLYILIGTLGLLAFWVLGQWFLPWFKIVGQSQEHIFIVFLLAGLVFFWNAVNSVYSLVAPALQRYDVVNKINLANSILTSLLTLGLVMLGYKLKAIMLLNLFFIIATGLLFRVISRKLLPKVAIKYVWVKEEIIKSYRFGVLSAMSSFSTYALAYLDRMIIPVFSGPAALSYYSMPGNVALKIPGVTNSLGAMLFPMASSLNAEGDKGRIAKIYLRVFRNISIMAAALTVAVSAFSYKILYFWLGQEFADKGWVILIILALTNYCLAIYTSLNAFVLGLGKVKTLVKFSFSMAILNLVLLLLLVPKYSILGAAWAYLISVLPVVFMVVWTEKYLEITNKIKFYTVLYSKILVTSLIYWLVAKYLLLQFVNTLWSLLIIGPFSILFFLLIYFILGFIEPEDMETFKAFIKAVKNKLTPSKKYVD